MKKPSALAVAIAASLGAKAGQAATSTATLVTYGTFSNSGSSAANITSSTATWQFDDVTGVVSQTGGTFNARFTTAPTSTLFRHTTTGLVVGGGGTASATTWSCVEGNFGGGVGASICGNYNFGANFVNDSTLTYSGATVFRNLNVTPSGDDGAIGNPQNVADLNGMITTVNSGTQITLSNGYCTLASPANCTTMTGNPTANKGYKLVYTGSFQQYIPSFAVDDTATTTLNTPTVIDVLANDSGLIDPVTLAISTPPDNSGSAVITNNGAAASSICASPCTAPAATIRIKLTPSKPVESPNYTEKLAYTVTGNGQVGKTAVVSVFVLNDPTPDPFTFTDGASAPLNTEQISNSITVTGVDPAAPISISGDPSSLYSINGGPFVGGPGTVASSDAVRVRHISSAVPGTVVDTVLNIGGVTDTFTSTTIKYAIADLASTVLNQPVQIAVLQNDNALAASVYTDVWVAPLHGTATTSGAPGAPSGIRITYTPDQGFAGVDSFEYWVETGLVVDYATVTVTVEDNDFDRDGVVNTADNCTLVPNPSQCDSDGDGYGNRCDADLTNNGVVNAQDTTVFRSKLGKPSVGPTYNVGDMNCNGTVNAQDTTIFRSLLGLPPGPSGLKP